jgi:hypothetical protein
MAVFVNLKAVRIGNKAVTGAGIVLVAVVREFM